MESSSEPYTTCFCIAFVPVQPQPQLQSVQTNNSVRFDLIAAFLACIELLLQSYNNARPQNRSNRTLKSAQLLLSQTASCTHLKRATNDAINP